MSLHLGSFASWRKLAAISFALLLFTIYYLLFTPQVRAQTTPLPCQNPVATDNLTDNYITQNGAPYWKFTVSVSGTPGQTVNITNANVAAGTPPSNFKVDFSKLQAIFGATNSDLFEGKYQDPNHQTANVASMNSQDKNGLYGPSQKIGQIAMLDQLRTKYVAYILSHPQLPEYAATYTDVNGQKPATISQMVTSLGFPNPPVPPSQGGDQNQWLNTWGIYWEKIPTAYNEFYQGKLDFRYAFGQTNIENTKKGLYCPVASLRTITLVMPDFFRTTAVSGQLNQLVVAKAAQSPSNNVILASAQQIKNVMAGIVNYCVRLATQNPVSQSLKKIISRATKILFSPVYAQSTPQQSCIKIIEQGKHGSAPYCALPANQLQPGDNCTDIPNDPNKLDSTNPNVICTFQISLNIQETIPTSGNGDWTLCTPQGGTTTCIADVAVWPDFRIPWLAGIWNNTTYSDANQNLPGNQVTGQPGVYTAFTPNAIFPTATNSQCDPNTDPNSQACKDLINQANKAAPSDSGIERCFNLFGLGLGVPPNSLLLCILSTGFVPLPKSDPGQTDSDPASIYKQRLIGSTDCSKIFVRDMALKPLAVQKAEGVDTSCVPIPTSSPGP